MNTAATDELWSAAIYAAAYMKSLAEIIEAEKRPILAAGLVKTAEKLDHALQAMKEEKQHAKSH